MCFKVWFKYEKATEVRRQFRKEFERDSPTQRTIPRIQGKFELDETVQDVHDGRSGRLRTSTKSHEGKTTAANPPLILKEI